MNIFALSIHPETCAIYHCDKHVRKMTVEYAQMICTNLNLIGIGVPYKPTHENHPANKWARKSSANFYFLCQLFIALSKEHEYRFNKTNLASIKCLPLATIENAACFNSRIGLTPFAQAMPFIFRQQDPIQAYRDFYCYDKSRFATWTKRKTPNWYSVKDTTYL